MGYRLYVYDTPAGPVVILLPEKQVAAEMLDDDHARTVLLADPVRDVFDGAIRLGDFLGGAAVN